MIELPPSAFETRSSKINLFYEDIEMSKIKDSEAWGNKMIKLSDLHLLGSG